MKSNKDISKSSQATWVDGSTRQSFVHTILDPWFHVNLYMYCIRECLSNDLNDLDDDQMKNRYKVLSKIKNQ